MAQGKSNAAIASSLAVSERAVEKHTNSIFSKLGLSERDEIHPRVQAVLIYLESARPATTPAVRSPVAHRPSPTAAVRRRPPCRVRPEAVGLT